MGSSSLRKGGATIRKKGAQTVGTKPTEAHDTETLTTGVSLVHGTSMTAVEMIAIRSSYRELGWER